MEKSHSKTKSAESPEEWVNRMIAKLCGAWLSLDVERAGATFSEELAEMGNRYGRATVEQGVSSAIRDADRSGATFAPSAPELRSYVRKAAEGSLTRTTCPLCVDGEGWIAVVGPEKKIMRMSDLTLNDTRETYRVAKCQHGGQQ